MSIGGDPKKDPRRGPITRWRYCEVPNKTSVCGWLASQPTWVKCHHVGNSKPCKRSITKSALVCPYCEAGQEPAWRGYTPFYDQDYQRRFVLLPEEMKESVSEILARSMIRLSRGKAMKEGLVIRAELWRTRPLPEDPERLKPVDLTAFMLHVLWKDAELIQWYAGVIAEKVRGVCDTPKKSAMSKDKGFANLRNRLAEGKGGAELLADVLPSLNGDGDHASNGKPR